jgi:hypothetical protein
VRSLTPNQGLEAPDGRIDVADVIRALRIGVGLEAASERELLVADVAPARVEPTVGLGMGDGAIDFADVVRLLRGAVGLDDLAWPVHRLAVHVAADAPAVAFAVVTEGWPREAEPLGFDSDTSCAARRAAGRGRPSRSPT